MKRIDRILLVLILSTFTWTVFPQASTLEQQFIDSAQTYFEKDEFDKAIAELDKGINISPRSPKLYLMRGDCKWLNRDLDGAVADYTRAIELGPNAPGIERAYYNRGTARQSMTNDINAFSDFEKAISIKSSYADPYYGRGAIFDKRGKTDFALKDFNKAIALDPEQTPAYSGRGNIRFRRNDIDGALADYNKSIELFPNGVAQYIIRGAIYGLKGKWELSLDDLRTGFEMNGELTLFGTGIMGVAFEDIDNYVAAYPRNARAHAVRGFINLLRKRMSEGDRDFQRSFQIDPKLKKDLQELIDSVKGRMEAEGPVKK